MSAALDAVVLGGGKPGDPLAVAGGAPVKALIELGGRSMAERVLEALRASGRVGRVAYVGPTTPAVEALVDALVPDAGGLVENAYAGLAALPGARRALVATADLPLLTPEAVRDLVDRDPGAAVVYPIVRDADAERLVPGGRRTYARVLEGRFTGGNLFLVDPAALERARPRVREVLVKRKNVLALAGIIGVGTVLKLIAGRLRIEEVEASASRILGAPARTLVTGFAEVGIDVDRPADLAWARRALERAPAAGPW